MTDLAVDQAAASPVDVPQEHVDAGSLKARVQARRRELEQEHDSTFVLPIPGFEQLLAVEYRPLNYREMMKLESRHSKNTDEAESVLFIAVDKMIAACERLVEVTGNPDEYADTGYRWNVQGVRECFGCELPDGATARQAVLKVFSYEGGEEDLILHSGEYETQRSTRRASVDRRVEGESEASSATD
jgi:hypothetical protein